LLSLDLLRWLLIRFSSIDKRLAHRRAPVLALVRCLRSCKEALVVLLACWSIKGGSGTTVVAAAFALLLARRSPGGAVLADLAGPASSGGDGAAVLGLDEPTSPGLAGWLASGDDVPADALARIEVRAGRGLGLLPRGMGPLSPARAPVLAGVLDAGSRPVVVDAGVLDVSVLDGGGHEGAAALAVVGAAQRSILVIRPCYPALRRAQALPLHPTGVVIVHDPGRRLGRVDVERAVPAPVVAEVPVDPNVAQAVDAGLLAGRLPRSLERSLRHAA
jgi:hypothetical protein